MPSEKRMPTVACPDCGHPVLTADGRCANCGRAVAPPTVADQPADPPATTADTLTQLPARPDAPTLTYAGGPARSTGPGLPGRAGAIPGYQIETELGRGGMGVVYLARELSLKRPVALKVLLAGTHAGARDLARFQAEATAAAAVQHPNVVEVYAVGEHGGLPYIALELIPGGSLDARLAAGPLDPADAARTVLGIARGVQTAHDRGVVHRDLKPSNVLFGADGQPKVADFGLAKLGDTGITATGAVMGTPAYMAPEQARGDARAAGPPADVWALGAILYECLAGRPPFKGQSAPETLRLVCEADPPPLSRAGCRVPKDLETIALKCLEKDPARRYPSAGAVADDLARFLAGEPVTARPRGRVVRLARWVGRHRGPVYAAAGALVAAALSLAALPLLAPKPRPPGPDKVSTARMPVDLALIPPDAFAVLCIRPVEVSNIPILVRLGAGLMNVRGADIPDPAQAEAALVQATGVRPSNIERITLAARDPDDQPGRPAPDFLIVMSAHDPVNAKPFRDKFEEFFGTTDSQDYRGHRIYVARSERSPFALFKAGEHELAFGSTTEVRAAIDRLADGSANAPPGPMRSAILEGHTAVFGGRPADLAGLIIGPEPGGTRGLPPPLARAIEQARTADTVLVTVDLLPATKENPLPGLDVTTRFGFRGDDRAATAVGPVREAFAWLGQPEEKPASAGPAALLPAVRRSAAAAAVRQEGPDVVVTGGPRFTARELAAAAKPPVPTTEANLRQIGLALHNYMTTHGRFPPAVIRSGDGRPLYSWRVELLPFVEQDQLYRKLRRDEPWDSPHNKPLLANAPRPFAMSPDDPAGSAGQTRFQAAIGKGGVFDTLTGTTFADIRDPSRDTLVVVEAGDPVAWAAPKDFVFDPARPVPALGGPAGNTFLALMADGSVRPLPRTILPTVLGAIITRDGGELVDWKSMRVTMGKR